MMCMFYFILILVFLRFYLVLLHYTNYVGNKVIIFLPLNIKIQTKIIILQEKQLGLFKILVHNNQVDT